MSNGADVYRRMVSEVEINDALMMGLNRIKGMTGSGHDLDILVRVVSEECFKLEVRGLYSLGVLNKYFMAKKDFVDRLCGQLPSAGIEVFAGVMLEELRKIPDVNEAYEVFMGEYDK